MILPYSMKGGIKYMRLNVKGKGMEVSEYLYNITQKKAMKLERYFKAGTEMTIMLSIEHGMHICEVTVPFKDVILRAEESSGDMYNSIDAALKKIERMIRKHRTKLEKRIYDGVYDFTDTIYDYDDVNIMDEEDAVIVKRKTFPAKPMDIEEAEMQMELLGHSFFVFLNSETNEVNVLYKRKDGNLGLIEPEYN